VHGIRDQLGDQDLDVADQGGKPPFTDKEPGVQPGTRHGRRQRAEFQVVPPRPSGR